MLTTIIIIFLYYYQKLVLETVKFRNSDPQPLFPESFGVAGSQDTVSSESGPPPHFQIHAKAIVCVVFNADNSGRGSIISLAFAGPTSPISIAAPIYRCVNRHTSLSVGHFADEAGGNQVWGYGCYSHRPQLRCVPALMLR